MEIFLAIILLIVGMVLLIKGADFFVEGAASIAKSLKIPSLVIGLTLVSIGTSAPEFSASLTSSIKGLNDISFGNIIGSNIFNIFVVIGVSAIIIPLSLSKSIKFFDIPILIGIYCLLILFSFVISPNLIEVWESIIIFSLTFIYTAFLIIRSRKEIVNEIEVERPKRKWYLNVILVIIGLVGIIFGGDLVVDNASSLATKLGMSDMLVGLTIVAVGTSLPELVTSIVAARKGENDVAIGNAIGSCLFNVVLILGLCSTIAPQKVDNYALVDVIVMLASVILLWLFAFKNNIVKRWHGIILVALYVAYLAYIIIRNVYAI